MIIVCGDFQILLCSFSKNKFEIIKKLSLEDLIIKVGETKNNEIFILTKDSIIILDDKFIEINRLTGSFNNFIAVSDYIFVISSEKNLLKYKYDNNIKSLYQITGTTIDISILKII